jgi:hypothetical protein
LTKSTNLNIRRVFAPQPQGNFSGISTGEVISVFLSQDEDVEWTWTVYPDGTRKVTGYTIITREHLKDQNSE